jgi:hypothetical protein
MSSLIAFGGGRERYLASRPLAEDPGPQATVRMLAEIWMVTCNGRLERARRILLSRDWESLNDEIVGPMPASLTTARYRVVAGVGIAQPVTAPNHAGRIALIEPPESAQHLYILGRTRRVIEHYAAETGAWRIQARYSLRGYLPMDPGV